jgi:hypothetical protein
MRLLAAWLEQCMLPDNGKGKRSSDGSADHGYASKCCGDPTSQEGNNSGQLGGQGALCTNRGRLSSPSELLVQSLQQELLGCKAGLVSIAEAVAQQLQAAPLLLNAVASSAKQKQHQGAHLSLIAQLLRLSPEQALPLLLEHQLLEVTRRVLLDSLGDLSSGVSRGGSDAVGAVEGGTGFGMGVYLVLVCCEVLLAAVAAAVALGPGTHSSVLLQQGAHQVRGVN